MFNTELKAKNWGDLCTSFDATDDSNPENFYFVWNWGPIDHTINHIVMQHGGGKSKIYDGALSFKGIVSRD
jgi:hypothetical protein